MAKKWLIGLVVILILMLSGIVCRHMEVQQQSKWTQRSEELLKIKKQPRKPLQRKNLFSD
jgi:hypothetical protein